jgi:hypothetical protein
MPVTCPCRLGTSPSCHLLFSHYTIKELRVDQARLDATGVGASLGSLSPLFLAKLTQMFEVQPVRTIQSRHVL